MREGKTKSNTRKKYESELNSIAKRGQGAIAPCRVKGQRPLWGLGQRPNCSASNLLKGRSQQGAGSEASLPVTSRVLRRAPKLLIRLTVLCRAKWRDQTACLSDVAGLFRKQGNSPLRRRVGGFAVAPDTPSQCTPMRLDFHRCRGNRACGRESGALRSPPTPLRSAHPCSLTVIVGWEKRNCPPSAPQSFPHADAPDSQTAPPAPGTAAHRPSAPQTG